MRTSNLSELSKLILDREDPGVLDRARLALGDAVDDFMAYKMGYTTIENDDEIVVRITSKGHENGTRALAETLEYQFGLEVEYDDDEIRIATSSI